MIDTEFDQTARQRIEHRFCSAVKRRPIFMPLAAIGFLVQTGAAIGPGAAALVYPICHESSRRSDESDTFPGAATKNRARYAIASGRAAHSPAT